MYEPWIERIPSKVLIDHVGRPNRQRVLVSQPLQP